MSFSTTGKNQTISGFKLILNASLMHLCLAFLRYAQNASSVNGVFVRANCEGTRFQLKIQSEQLIFCFAEQNLWP